MNKRRISWMTMGMIGVCLLAVLFAVISIISASSMAEQTNQMYEHPYQVKAATESMRTRLVETEYYLPTLLGTDSSQMEEVKELLAERDKRQDDTFEIIRSRYQGPEEDVEDLEAALKEVQQARSRAVEEFAEGGDYEEILAYIEEEIKPYHQAVENVLDRIATYADYRVELIWTNTVSIKNITIIGAVALCLLIIVMVILANVNEKRKNKEIAYREQLFNLLSNNIDDVFYIYDYTKDQMEYVSGNSMRVLGIGEEEFYKDPLTLRNYLTEETRGAFDSLFEARPIDNSECDVTFINNEIIKNFQIQIYAIYSKSRLQRLIAVMTDLTKIVEQQKILNDALLSAQKANSAKRDFLTRMSHEIRTPMNTIIGMTAIAMRHMDDEEYMENCLSKITSSSGHLLSLINDILDMSKIEDNKLSINYEQFDFRKQLESITAVVYPQTVERKQNFDMVIHDLTQEKLIGDVLRVNQILLNLLSNAVKFTPEGGKITLDVSKIREKKDQVFLRFIVRDSGIGMSEEYLQRLYTPFEQADNSIAQKYGGSGLGMSITKNLVALLDGTITVQSAEGKGTTFTVELPFGIAEQENFIPQEEFHNIKVLVVDDDEDTCEHTILLMENLGVHASWVNSGRKAIEVVLKAHETSEDYDVCFIDWRMPDMDGLETARNIRKCLGPDTLIIIISAYDWTVIEKEAREAGVNAFISKPMFASSIYNALNAIMMPKNGHQVNKNQISYDFNGKKVLLAEDNLINQEIVVELLKDVDIIVECAGNGKLALDMYEQSEPDEYDLILMDVQMPVMDGYEATRAIRSCKHPKAATVPILAMTANAFNEDVAAAKEAGMNGHLSKPVDIDMLYKTLAEYILSNK